MQDILETYYGLHLKNGESSNRKRKKKMENDFLERLINLAAQRVMERVRAGERRLITDLINEELSDLLNTLENYEKARRQK